MSTNEYSWVTLEIELTSAEAAAGTTKKLSIEDPGESVREITVRIPAGVKHDTLIRLPGQGPRRDPDTAGDALSGRDALLVRVRITDSEPVAEPVAAPVAAPEPAPRATRPLGTRWPVAAAGVATVTLVAAIFLPAAPRIDSVVAGAAPTTTRTTPTTTWVPTTSYVPVVPPVVPPVIPPVVPIPDVQTSTVPAAPQDTAEVGGCLTNAGTDITPNLIPSTCVKGSYRVLDRHYGTISDTACNGSRKTTHTYIVEKYTVYTRGGIETNRTTNLPLSYVICLAQL